jgi:alpha-ketoglutarate-dependent taurine dioxygenase
MRTEQEDIVLEVTPESTGMASNATGLRKYLESVKAPDELLVSSGAILMHGFDVEEAVIADLLDDLLPDRMDYVHGNSPRTKTARALYTSTEYPADQTISLHNELSYASSYPTRLLFYCSTAARTGGATPVADGQRWLSSLRPDVRDLFAGGVRYIQNLHSGVGLGRSWQDTFETADRRAVERLLDTAEVEWSWESDDLLHTEQTRSATLQHPVTGTIVWFNQADQWHPAGLGDSTGAMLAGLMPPEELPQYVTLADGRKIPDEVIHHIQECGRLASVDIAWHTGDLVLVDNIARAHGREPFTGPRRVLVAMSDRPFAVSGTTAGS